MGCFDTNCPISGMPIKNNDKVKWAFITSTDITDGGVYVCDDYKFLFPLMDGIANDYGNLHPFEFDSYWKENVWDNLAKRLIKVDYNKKESPLPEDFSEIIDLIKRNNILYKSRFINFNLKFWMVHDWAFNYISSIDENCREMLLDDADMYIRSIEAGLGMGSKLSNCQGFLASVSNFYITATNDEFKKSLLESAAFINGLFFIRKTIQPMTICGMQHDDYKYLTPWFNLLSERCKSTEEEYNRGR